MLKKQSNALSVKSIYQASKKLLGGQEGKK